MLGAGVEKYPRSLTEGPQMKGQETSAEVELLLDKTLPSMTTLKFSTISKTADHGTSAESGRAIKAYTLISCSIVTF